MTDKLYAVTGSDLINQTLALRLHLELTCERVTQRVELPDSVLPVAGTRIQPHQGAVGGLMKRVELKPAPRDVDRRPQLSCSGQRVHEPLERFTGVATELLRLKERPILELGRVAQEKTRHEVTAGQLRGLPEVRDAPPANLVGRVVVGPGCADQLMESGRVQPHVFELERHTASSRRQPRPPQPLAQGGERPPERGPCSVLVEVGPQQGGQGIATVRAAGDRQISKQGYSLARVYLDGGAVQLDPGRPEQPDLQLGHVARNVAWRTGVTVTIGTGTRSTAGLGVLA